MQADFGQVGQTRATAVDGQIAQCLQLQQFTAWLYAQASPVLGDLSRRYREVGCLQLLHQLVEGYAMRTDAILVQRHQHLLFGDAFHFHARHTRQPLKALLDAAFDHVGTRGQVLLAVEAQADRFLVAGTPALHVVAPEVIGQLVANRVDAFTRFGRRHGDVTAPIAEFDLDLAAFGVGT
ncbi:hypothetical protein D3C81_1165190 [compost metagenome]